jgi:sulfite exporter TauE/SafE
MTSEIIANFLRTPGIVNAFLAGVFTGLLPCGLLYAFLTLATSTASMVPAALVMLAFGCGTLPVMVLTGAGVTVMGITTRQRLYRFAAWCIVLTGLISCVRGISTLCAGG